MAEKRKDIKGRVLQSGESQIKEGKFRGRYQYDYTDLSGRRRHVNSWRLTEADPLPAGHRPCRALRSIKAEILQDLKDGIDSTGKNKTINELFDVYLASKIDLRESTRQQYKRQWEAHARDSIGRIKVSKLKNTDVRSFFAEMVKNGYAQQSCRTVNALLTRVLDNAVRDDLIRKNPARGVLGEFSGSNKTEPRHALTKEEQQAFLSFVAESPRFNRLYNFYMFLFCTGCRISEALAVTWADIDLNAGIISINKTISEWKGENGQFQHISEPKTSAGRREIPIAAELRPVLERMGDIARFKPSKCAIDGHTGFLFLTGKDTVHRRTELHAQTKEIIEAANKAGANIRPFSPHSIRHTFCTRLCEAGTNPRVIMAIMGHTDIKTTLNIYAECQRETVKGALNNVDVLGVMGYTEEKQAEINVNE